MTKTLETAPKTLETATVDFPQIPLTPGPASGLAALACGARAISAQTLLTDPPLSGSALQPLTAAQRNPALVYLATLGTGSRAAMRRALDLVAGLLLPNPDGTPGVVDGTGIAWHAVRYEHLAAVRASLKERYHPRTTNKILCACRGVLKEAWHLRQISGDDYQLVRSVKGVTIHTVPDGLMLTGGDLRALVAVCKEDERPRGARDAAVFAVLHAGLRRAEVVALDVEHFAMDGTLTVRRGKGNKDRICYLAPGGIGAMQAWLVRRGTAEGPLFLPINRGGRLVPRRLTPQAVLQIVATRSGQAKVQLGPRPPSPHRFRRHFVAELLDAGVDLNTAKELAGHARIETTVGYDHRGEAPKKRAVSLLHFPY